MEAVRVNSESRLRALKIGILLMALVAMLAIFRACKLPGYIPREVPDPSPKPARGRAASLFYVKADV